MIETSYPPIRKFLLFSGKLMSATRILIFSIALSILYLSTRKNPLKDSELVADPI